MTATRRAPTAATVIGRIARRDGRSFGFVWDAVADARKGAGTRQGYEWHQEVAQAATRAGTNTTDYLAAR